ncbi:MAG: alpha/beta hydrolase [Acidimicrobiales bacterium]
MQAIIANGITIEYDTFGDAASPPVLLIMGLGAQMTLWEPEFCQGIADRGYFVIRFDNRDIGLSSWLDDLGTLELADIITGAVSAPYSLVDMASDAAGLLDALGIESAHIIGASMGGMIAQSFAIAFPDKTRSLTSIMSTTGNPEVGQASSDALGALLGPPPNTRDEAIERGVLLAKVIGSPGYDLDEASLRTRAASDYDRAFHPAGTVRQVAAVVAQPDRTADLRKVRTPTLVIHGADDPLVDQSGGRATAEAVAGATLEIMPGMGHDLPPALWDAVTDSLVANFARA